MQKSVITRTVWILSLVSLFADIASEMLYPVVPTYLRSIGFSLFLIGVLEGMAELTAGISKGSFGQWSDHSPKRGPFVRWGYFLGACSKPMIAMLSYPLWIFFARTLDRLGKGMRTAPRDALLSLESEPETKAQVFGFHRAMDTTGAVIGPILALAYLRFVSDDIRMLLFLAFIPGMVAVAISFFLQEKPRERLQPQTNSSSFFHFFSYWNRSSTSYRSVVVPFILFALFNSSDVFLLLRVRELSGSMEQTLLVYVLYNFVYALAAFPLGILADRIGIRPVVLTGLMLFALCYSGMTYAEGLYSYILIFCLYGLCMAAIESNVKAWVSNATPVAELGTGIGLFASMQSIGLSVASVVAGLVWTTMGPSVTFLMSAIVAVIAFLLLLTISKNDNLMVREKA